MYETRQSCRPPVNLRSFSRLEILEYPNPQAFAFRVGPKSETLRPWTLPDVVYLIMGICSIGAEAMKQRQT